MSRNGVAGFNLLDDNFSRDASELDISEVGTAFVEKRFQQTIKKNTFKGVARGAMDMPMFRSVEGYYGYTNNSGAGDYPLVYVTLQNNANLKVTWDPPDAGDIHHYYLVLRENEGNHIDIFIGNTQDTTREFTINLENKYYPTSTIDANAVSPSYSLKENISYTIFVKMVSNSQASANLIRNNQRALDIKQYSSAKIGESYTFKLIKKSSGPPTGVTGVIADSSVTINWNAPSALTATGQTSATTDNTEFYIKNKGYRISYVNDTHPTLTETLPRQIVPVIIDVLPSSISSNAPTTKLINFLTNYDNYDFTLYSISYIGYALSDPTDTIRLRPAPPASKPATPIITSVIPGIGSATVNWTPGDDGGSPITKYNVYAFTTQNPNTSTVLIGGGYNIDIPPTSRSAVIPNLTNGVMLTFIVEAINAVGNSDYGSGMRILLTAPPTAPSAPTNVRATALNESATVSWNTPVSIGSSNITGYIVRTYIGNSIANDVEPVDVDGTLITTTVTGLTNGTAYTFKVTATNSAGPSLPSSPSSPVTPFVPATAPSAPTITAVTPGNATATVTWTPPTTIGAQSITKYTVTTYIGNSIAANVIPVDVSGNVTTTTVTGLTNGTAYTFKLTATNSANLQSVLSSPSSSITPVVPATAPSAPTGVNATPGNATATVTWTPPTTIGSSTITKYTVTAYPGTSTTPVDVSGTVTTITVTGLTNGTAYTFKLTATNSANLTSVLSSPSSSVTPVAPLSPPGKPRSVNASQGDTTSTVTWLAPTPNGSTAITGYSVKVYSGTYTSSSTPVKSVDVSANILTATLTDLTNESPYSITVTAISSSLPGEPSDPVSITLSSVTGPPGIPTNLLANRNSNNTVVLSWTAPTNLGGDKSVSYTVQMCSDSACTTILNPYPKILNSSPETTLELNPGTYYFRVNTKNSKYSSIYTTTTSVTIPTAGGTGSGSGTGTGTGTGSGDGTTPGITAPLNSPASSAYKSDPITSLVIATLILGAIFMAVFSPYSPVNLKKLKI